MNKSLSKRLRALEGTNSRADLRQRLERVYRRGSTSKTFPDEQVVRAHRGIHDFVTGEYENTSFGDVFIARKHFPWNHEHGKGTIGWLKKINGDWLSRLGKFANRTEIDLANTIFMDTETTGLAGGTGTLAFLIGIGFIEEGGFTVLQYFADGFNCEEGMLDLVADFVKPYTTVVTFNGKTYDLPLLATRYILKRSQSPFEDLEHLDLLHIARQIWGYQMQDCRLQTIEKEVLNFFRTDDLPGREVPQAYFKFLRGQGADPLYRVFEHNADDILTLGVVLPLIWELTRPDSMAGEAQLSRSRILIHHGEITAARQVLEAFVSEDGNARLRQLGRLELGRLYKKAAKWKLASQQWKMVLKEEAVFFLEPYVELAKFYEHRKKDWEKARYYAVFGLSKLASGRTKERQALEHRIRRLRKKIARSKN